MFAVRNRSAMPLNCLRLLSLLLFTAITISAADPDALQDYCVADTNSSIIFMNGLPCLNSSVVTVNHFMTSVLGTPGNTAASRLGFTATLTGPQILPGVNTLGLIMARADVAVGGIVPPHTHPRATEMVFIAQGKLRVGFVDTSNKLFTADVKAGDVFVFPKGTVHYQQNIGSTPALIIVAFNSQNPGVIVTHQTTFAANPSIPPQVLSKAFNISLHEVEKIRRGLGGS